MLDVGAARVLARSGLLSPTRPDRLLGMALGLARWRLTLATVYAVGAARHPDRPALVDDEGTLTYREVDRRTDRMAAALRERGLREGDAVGLLARNGRHFVEGAVALAKCGADVLHLGTGTAAGQLRQVLDRESAVLCLHDEEFGAALAAAGVQERLSTTELAERAAGSGTAPWRTTRTSRQVILTSGTTGPPKGAARSGASATDGLAVLSLIPLRGGGTTYVAAPLFHAWGLGNLALAAVLGSTVVLQARFDPERALQALQDDRVDTLVVVPVLLDRLLGAGPERYRTALRVIASSGGALPGDLVARTAAAFGPVLYNLYGSTEVAYAAIATPQDLARDPRTAGRAPRGVTLRVVDEAGRDCPAGTPGRVFVGNGLAFGGYTDGGDRERLGDLVATGDLGVLDADGRLTVLGRDDDMVVVGGENVFTGQVEDVLLGHPAVDEVAVVAHPDDAYGARLVAHVVAHAPVTEQELQDRVRAELARAAAPREVRFVDALPRNATGKVLKRALREGVDEP